MTGKEYVKTMDRFVAGQAWLNDVDVQIDGGEANVDPLELLRRYEQPMSADNNLALAQQFMLNKHVTITRNGNKLLDFVYTGGNIAEHFVKAPYLLETVGRFAYGLMLKKLTPPSDTTESGERQ